MFGLNEKTERIDNEKGAVINMGVVKRNSQ